MYEIWLLMKQLTSFIRMSKKSIHFISFFPTSTAQLNGRQRKKRAILTVPPLIMVIHPINIRRKIITSTGHNGLGKLIVVFNQIIGHNLLKSDVPCSLNLTLFEPSHDHWVTFYSKLIFVFSKTLIKLLVDTSINIITIEALDMTSHTNDFTTTEGM